MKFAKYLAVLMILALSMFGASCGSSGTDASEACDDLCDRVDECDLDGFDEEFCHDLCDDVDDAEDEVDGGCEDAVKDLFQCGEDLRCSEIEGIDFGAIEDVFDLILIDIEECADEAADVRDECADDLPPGLDF